MLKRQSDTIAKWSGGFKNDYEGINNNNHF